jgi:CheY-like chemotaxis protein
MAGELLLNSWKEIARYVGRSERTVQRWEKQCGFPVRRPAGKTRSAVIALPSEIQGWSRSTALNGGSVVDLAEEAEVSVSDNTRGCRPTLLCIDDHPEGLAIRKVLLEAMGYRVLAAPNAQAGLRLFDKNRVDLVVCDYWISDLDGEALTRMLHELKPRVPILLLSGATKSIPEGVLKLVDNFVQKGQPTDVLLSAVAGLCAKIDSIHLAADEPAEAVPGPSPESQRSCVSAVGGVTSRSGAVGRR